MTKKHYESFAEIFRVHLNRANGYHDTDRPDPEYVVVEVAREVACYLQRENPRFDPDRFLKACGVDNPFTRARRTFKQLMAEPEVTE